MRKIEIAVIGASIGAITGAIARYHAHLPGWAVVIACAVIGGVAGYGAAIARR